MADIFLTDKDKSELDAKIGTKSDKGHKHTAADIGDGVMQIANGGTGATNAKDALKKLGAIDCKNIKFLQLRYATESAPEVLDKPELNQTETCTDINTVVNLNYSLCPVVSGDIGIILYYKYVHDGRYSSTLTLRVLKNGKVDTVASLESSSSSTTRNLTISVEFDAEDVLTFEVVCNSPNNTPTFTAESMDIKGAIEFNYSDLLGGDQ